MAFDSAGPKGMGLRRSQRRARPRRACGARIAGIEARLEGSVVQPAREPGRAHGPGHGPAVGPHEVVVDDRRRRSRRRRRRRSLLATGSRPRIPDWATVDGERVLTTRDAYPPPELPEHLVVIGSGVTGVEFVHMFRSFGCEVTLIVQPPAGAAAEGPRGRRRARGRLPATAACSCSRAPGPTGIDRDGDDGVVVRCDDGRVGAGHPRAARHRLGPQHRRASASTPPASRSTRRLRRRSTTTARRNVPHIYAAGDLSGQAAAVVGGRDAGPQDRRARDGPAQRAAPPPRLRQGGVGDLHRARDRRRRPRRGRGVRRGPQDPRDQGAVLGVAPRRSSTTTPAAS